MKIINISVFIVAVCCSMNMYVSSGAMSASAASSSAANNETFSMGSINEEKEQSFLLQVTAAKLLFEQFKRGKSLFHEDPVDIGHVLVSLDAGLVLEVNPRRNSHSYLDGISANDTGSLERKYAAARFWLNTRTGETSQVVWMPRLMKQFEIEVRPKLLSEEQRERAALNQAASKAKSQIAELKKWDEQVSDYKK